MKRQVLILAALLLTLSLPSLARAATCTSMAITTTSTTTPSVAAQNDRSLLVIDNIGANTFYCSLDGSTPTTTAGVQITSGQMFTGPSAATQYSLPRTFTGKILCVTATGTSTAYVCTQ